MMKEVFREFQMNGPSVSWAARTIAIGVPFLLVGIVKLYISILLIGIILVGLAFGLALSKTVINLDKQNNVLLLKYLSLFKRTELKIQLTEKDFISFEYLKQNHLDDWLTQPTVRTWHPVKNSSYFVILRQDNNQKIVLSECIDSKETHKSCLDLSSKIGLNYISPLKKK